MEKVIFEGETNPSPLLISYCNHIMDFFNYFYNRQKWQSVLFLNIWQQIANFSTEFSKDCSKSAVLNI